MKLTATWVLDRFWPHRGTGSGSCGTVPSLSVRARLFEAAVAAAGDGLVVCNAAGQVTLVNPSAARMLDVGQGFESTPGAWQPEHTPILRALDQAMREGEATLEVEFGQDEMRRCLTCRATRIGSEAAADGAVLVLRDVTEERGRWTRRTEDWEALAHDLKTPLNSIGGFATLLLQDAVGPLNGLQRDFVSTIQQEGRRLSSAILSFLDESREAELGESREPSVSQVGTVTAEAIERLHPLAMRKQLTIEAVAPSGLQPVQIEPDKLSLVMLNLLDNAIGFSPEMGRVLISAGEREGAVEISVEDEGVGIPSAELPMVFDRYYRAANQPESGRPGVGLGLAICKQLVEQHGGQIWAENVEPHGARFVCTLPMVLESAGVAALVS